MMPQRNPRAAAQALRNTPGIIDKSSRDPDGGLPHHHTAMTIDAEFEDASGAADAGDEWGNKRIVRDNDAAVEFPPAADEPATLEEDPIEVPAQPTPARAIVKASAPPTLPKKKVVLETDQYTVKLEAVGIEINRPFLVLIHDEEPDFAPKGRSKFLATAEGAQYHVVFLGIQFPIKSYGLYITTFVFDDQSP